MNRRDLIALSAAAVVPAFLAASAIAQQPDIEAVKAASRAFYAALPVFDNGEAMDKVWAHTNYVTYVGPRSKSVIVGWEDQKKYWVDNNKLFSKREATLSDQHIHVVGNLAWEVGQETGETKPKDGPAAKIDFIVTNVYEKVNGRWLMVSHHVQPKPQ